MGKGEAPGLQTAVESVGVGEAPVDGAEQLPLIADADVRGDAEGVTIITPGGDGERGPGRPVGSKNKRTVAWVDFILQSHQSPLVFLAGIIDEDLGELAERLKITLAEALDRKIDAAKALLPYLHSKRPLALQISSEGRVSVHVTGIERGREGPAGGGGAGMRTISAEIMEPGQESEDATESTT